MTFTTFYNHVFGFRMHRYEGNLLRAVEVMGSVTLKGSLFLNEANGRCLVRALHALQQIHVPWCQVLHADFLLISMDSMGKNTSCIKLPVDVLMAHGFLMFPDPGML